MWETKQEHHMIVLARHYANGDILETYGQQPGKYIVELIGSVSRNAFRIMEMGRIQERLGDIPKVYQGLYRQR